MLVPEATTHAVIFDDTYDQILLIQSEAPWGEVVWDFPGGRVHLGETVKNALLREVKEETGYGIEILCLFNVYDHIISDESSKEIVAHLIDIIWIARGILDNIESKTDKKIIRVEWFKTSSISSLNMPTIAHRILRDVGRVQENLVL